MLQLLTRCIRDVFHRWELFSNALICHRLPTATCHTAAIVHLFCSADAHPPTYLQEHLCALLRTALSDKPSILIPLLEEFGVNHDMDALSIQTAYLSSGLCSIEVDAAVYSLWMAMFQGEGPLSIYIDKGQKPIVHGEVGVTWQLLLDLGDSFVTNSGFHVAGSTGSPVTKEAGWWLVMEPNNEWDEAQCVLHFRGTQPALFMV